MNTLDRFIGYFAPAWAVNRIAARATLSQMAAYTGGSGGYDAGRLNRLTKAQRGTSAKEFEIPGDQIDRLRYESWNLFRNNTYARKIVRSLESKVIGQGLHPDSMAVNDDGTPAVEFRRRAKELWNAIQSGFDYRGLPGRGGLTMGGLQRLALRATILSGDSLYRLVPVLPAEQIGRDIPVPVTLQVIDCSRLADDVTVPTGDMPANHVMYRGIELDADGRRVRYWLKTYLAGTSIEQDVVSIPAEQVGHLFLEDDIDQYRGVPWFASALLQMRDTGDLQYNVLMASKMAACVVLGYRKPTGASRWGLNASSESNPTSADGTDLTDADGNAITKIQPGMFVNLGRDGELQGFSPPQLNMNSEAFIQHMLRGTAAGLPGIKSSTVTGDYRNSSFSSEKSADNDTWPEIQALQEWFSTSFCQPIYDAVIRAGVLAGYFDGIIDPVEFGQNAGRYVDARWQGPVSLSINPTDDINAAALRMQHGISSPQKECAKVGVGWREVINDIAEFYTAAREAGLPDEVVNNVLSVGSQDVIAQTLKQDQQTQQTDSQATEAEAI